MKKVFLMVLMGLLFVPMGVFADQYEYHEVIPADDEPPVRSPGLYFVNAWIDSYSGEFSICANYDITCLYVTVAQNNVVLDSFSRPVYNGVPVTYDFSVYPTGEYLVTLSTVNGVIKQYIVTVEHD